MSKTSLIHTLSCWLLLTAALPAAAQSGKFYSTGNGLSSSLINHIYQDRQGFIWIASEYGIERFDGLRFTSYKHQDNDSTSLRNNYVHAFFEDSRRNLLVGCIDGLMRYDADNDDFLDIPMYRAGKRVYPHVTRIARLHDGTLWVATSGQGIFSLDETRWEAHSVEELMRQLNYNFCSDLYEDTYNNIWIGTEGNGLACYTPGTRRVQLFKHPAIADNFISAIGEDRHGNLFVGTQKQGLMRYDRTKGTFVDVRHAGGDDNLSVYCLGNVDGRLLVGTDGQGLKAYNPATDRLEDYRINAAPMDFSAGKIHAIFEDRDHNLWLGLFQKGIVLIPRQENPFDYYGAKSIYGNPIGQGCVMSIFQDSRHHLWVGADSEGLYELSEQGRRLRHLTDDGTPHSIASTIICMYEDSRHNFWVGSYTRGLGLLDRNTGRCTYPLPAIGGRIFSITEDDHQNLYIATFGSGFYRYNLLTHELKHYESSKDETGDLTRNEPANDWINYIFHDSEGLIWLAHYKGISCFNPRTESFINYRRVNTLIEDRIGYVISEDHAGNIWAGTNDGLYRFDKQTETIRRFTMADGLPNNVICGIVEDARHNLWISTYMGICRYDVRGERVVNYYAGDGLQGNEFTHGAFYENPTNGRVYFGGTEGITAFLPTDIGNELPHVQVHITDFLIFDRPVHRDTRSGGQPVVYSNPADAKVFKMAHYDNTFSVVFSTMRYTNPEQIAYQYRIEGLGDDDRWLTTEPGVNHVTYNNLSPGRYTFYVRAYTHGATSDVRRVRIIITPPWYAMWWAYAIYVALGGLLLLGIINYILSRMNHRRELMKSEHAQQLNEAKLQFFINISHEIRTPMTLIISPLEKLLAEHPGDKRLQQTYLMIYRNAQRILRLINQLMDIRKLDKGQMFLRFRETDMVGFIADVMLTFDYLARKKHIDFTFRHADEQLKVWIDLNNFDKVLMNILSNAFKYTPDEGEITVALTTGHDPARRDPLRNYFEITVTDSGIGIDRHEMERIFERFYQIDNDVTKSNFGTGIGLHLSRSLFELHHGIIRAENRDDDHSGSRFIIRLPMGSAHLRLDELEQPDSIATPLRPQPETLPTADDDTTEPIKPKTHARLFIVEDDTEIAAYLRRELADMYRITLFRNGREAYEAIFTDTPDLVISDIMMPEMDGLQLCRKIKQNPTVNHLPVILLTARSKPEDTMEGMAIGADAYMVKPFNTELLRSTIANLLDNRRLLKSKFSGAQQQEDKRERIVMKSSDEQLMNRIMKVINENLSNPDLNVEMLAVGVGLSRVHVHRKLKELTNLSARDFIRNIRLGQAATLLCEKKLTISEVAYATGFTNLSHFSASFREMHGMTPKEYMNAHLHGNSDGNSNSDTNSDANTNP
jgi:signal transduction histidine kinase/ligand-binding sensor domain-containing protein/DNA-binding response OmpR family regulator